MRIIFMGTPEFAVPCLEALLDEHEVVTVVSQPDKAQGRGRKITATPVKKFAQEHDLVVIQPENINCSDAVEFLHGLQPDVLVVVAYGQLLKRKVLNLAKWGAINVHASLLPKLRGGAPIHRALMNGDKESGITIMKIEPKLDSGPILMQKAVQIDVDETLASLHNRLASLGAEMLLETLQRIDEIIPQAQKHAEATYASLITKQDRIIDWSKSAEQTFNQIRGLNPWPTAFTYYRGKQIQIWESKKINQKELKKMAFGQIIDITPDGPVVLCGNNAVVLTRVQPAGKRKMTGSEFCRGYRCTTDDIFGEREE